MTRFHLTVEQLVTNDAYEAELRAWTEKNRGYGHYPGEMREPEPQRERSIKVLSVSVSEVEFAAIKKAALATMA